MSSRAKSELKAELREYRPAYVTLFAFSFFSPLLYLAAPLYMEQIVDRVMLSRNEFTLWVLFVIATFVIFMLSVLDHLRSQALLRLGAAIDAKLTRVVFAALHRPRSGRAGSATLNDINGIRDFLSGPMIGATFDAIWSPIFILAMLIVHPIYGATALVLVLLTAALSFINHFLVAGLARNASACHAASSELGSSIFRTAETVRALGMLPALREHWYAIHRASLGWQNAAGVKNLMIANAVKFLRTAQIIIVYTIGTLLYLREEVSAGTLMYGAIIMLRGVGPIDYLISSWKQFSSFKTSFERLDDLLAGDEAKVQRVALPKPDRHLDVARIVGSPPGSDKIVINDVSFQLSPGRALGVIGQSGAGKSCLGRFLVGIWPLKRGAITLDEHLLAHWDEDQLGPHIGYLPQDIELLPGTLAENISRFQPSARADPSSLLAAIESAGIHELIREMPQGLNTRVGAGGHVLSGGQRQRIALARALYGQPFMLVLDEPTSNLDAAGEQSLMQAIERHKAGGGLSIVITHKLSLLSCCDDVLVLHAGTVQALGPRPQILERMNRAKVAAPPALTLIAGAADGRGSK